MVSSRTSKCYTVQLALMTSMIFVLVEVHAVGPRHRHPYRRFEANSSFVGQPVPCTSDEKICFGYNLMFYPTTEKCLPLGGLCDVRVNNEEFEHGSGHIVASCPKYEDPCPGFRMAYDNRCYPRPMVQNIICGCNSNPIPHFLRGVECQCNPKTPVHVEQPAERGHCLIPDFSYPDSERSFFFEDILGVGETLKKTLSCSPEQIRCFSESQVWVSEGKGCFDLLSRGPCAEEHLVVLDQEAAKEQRAVAICAHKLGGCPRGQMRMEFDGQCHEERRINITAPGYLSRNVFGHFKVIQNYQRYNFNPKTDETKSGCGFHVSVGYDFVGSTNLQQPVCGSDDQSQCSLFELESEPPEPLYDD